MTARSYLTEYHRDHHRDARLHWRLYTYGPGHWCVGNGHSGTFVSQEAAELAGKLWISTGLPPCEQDRVSRCRDIGGVPGEELGASPLRADRVTQATPRAQEVSALRVSTALRGALHDRRGLLVTALFFAGAIFS